MGRKYRGHPRAAGHSRRQEEEVARASLRSPRRPLGRKGRWSRPDKGFSKRSASAGRHGDKDVEKQRSLSHMPRVHWQRVQHAGERACVVGRARFTLGVARGVQRSCRTTRPPLERRPPTRWLLDALHLDLTRSRLPDGLPKRSAKALENHTLESPARLRAHSSSWIHGGRA